jgi:hypothetical protein
MVRCHGLTKEVDGMATTMRNAGSVAGGEPLSRGRSAMGRPWWWGVARFLRWSAARPIVTVVTLTLVYLATLAALTAVLAASATQSIIGLAVLTLFAAEVLVYLAIAVYIVIPEKAPRSRRSRENSERNVACRL